MAKAAAAAGSTRRWNGLYAAGVLLAALGSIAIALPFTALAQLTPAAMPMGALDADATPCQGQTPAKIIIDRVVAYPQDGQAVSVTLRNIGGQTANLTGWRLTDSDTRNVEAAQNLVFGTAPCDNPGNSSIESGRTLELKPKSDSNPCGFPFGLSFRDEVHLFDATGQEVVGAKWGNSNMGAALRQLPSVLTVTNTGTDAYQGSNYRELPENKPVLELLQDLGGYSIFLEALKAAGLESQLAAASAPNYTGPPPKPEKPQSLINPEFPWWFGFGVDRSKLPPPPPPPAPPPPPPPGVPAEGPYTILAPTDDAFNTLLTQLGGGRPLPKERLLALPELKDIMLYHILPGAFLTNDMYNNTPIWTAKAVEITPFVDPCQTEGRVALHDGCVDKPTPDNFTCEDQVKFNKCYFPFLTSALAAQWQGGFCQRTCQRCSCAPGSGITCAQVVLPDARASNGVVQGISRVLFPPPVFTKADVLNMSMTAPTIVPGGAAAAVPQAGLPGNLIKTVPEATTTPGPAPATAPDNASGTEQAPVQDTSSPSSPGQEGSSEEQAPSESGNPPSPQQQVQAQSSP